MLTSRLKHGVATKAQRALCIHSHSPQQQQTAWAHQTAARIPTRGGERRFGPNRRSVIAPLAPKILSSPQGIEPASLLHQTWVLTSKLKRVVATKAQHALCIHSYSPQQQQTAWAHQTAARVPTRGGQRRFGPNRRSVIAPLAPKILSSPRGIEPTSLLRLARNITSRLHARPLFKWRGV
ncbi:unnamed protein product [Linum trigynum]|uniref:Uncharacterized protein n=1 Tax=Linum trigynum TaxID=586398 RepID=A0AAV2CLT3_9ROSI